MARPSIAEATAALSNLYNALSSGNTPWRVQRSGAAIDALGEVASAVATSMLGTAVTVTDTNDADLQAFLVHPNLAITVTDTADADLEAFVVSGGELYDAYGRAPVVGDAFQVSGTGDTTDNALETAKGSAAAANDIFIVSNATATTIAVVYAGNDGELGLVYGRKLEVGDVFTVAGTGDTTDNALLAAKTAGLDIDAQITISDTTDATIAALTAATGELGIDIGAMQVRDGFRFRVLGTGDTTDNALQTAKGGAPAAGDVFEVTTAGAGVTYIDNIAVAAADVFEVTNVTIGSEAVAYLGTGAVTTSGISLGRGI